MKNSVETNVKVVLCVNLHFSNYLLYYYYYYYYYYYWRLAANILNKQSWTADQEWSSSLGVWREANNLTL